MEFTINDQIRELFLSCGMGFILGFYYEIFRVPRLVLRSGKKALFFQDFFFCLSAAVITFLFSLAVMDGRLRLYLFLGEAIGFAAYYFTVGRLVVRFSVTAVNFVRLFIAKAWSVISVPLCRFIDIVYSCCNKTVEIIKLTAKKATSILKNVGLQ